MAAASTVVIKVKYGEMLRRFTAQVVDDKLVLNMDGLRNKISSLFSFAPDTELMLTYIDEDNDVVALVDNDDLCDVVKQGLNPLRITVRMNDEKNGRQYNHSSAGSTPLRSPHVQPPLPNLNDGVSVILRKVPEPFRETLVKLSEDLASKASSSAPGISELVDYFSKVSLSYLGQISEAQAGGDSNLRVGIPESSKAATEPNSQKSNVTQPGNDCLDNLVPAHSESGVVSDTVGKKEKVDNAVEFPNWKSILMSHLPPVVLDSNIAGKEVCNPSEPKLGSDGAVVSALDPTRGGHVNDRSTSVGKSPPPNWTPDNDGLNLGSFSDSNMYDCPVSGTILENNSAAASQPASGAARFRRSTSQNDSCGNVFRHRVQCDGCGIHPIVGPRFKSKVKIDYDLCGICFEEMGNDNDYIRMDYPADHQPLVSFKGLHDARTRNHRPMFPHGRRGSKVKLGAVKLDSLFIQDVNIFDGTIMAPSTPFTKIWRMRNSGTVMWPQKTQLVWIGGDKLSNAVSVEVQIPAAGLAIDEELDVAVDFISPDLPGRYISYWRMASPSGQKFGQRVWVLIQVELSVRETPCESVRNLNLNLPPVSSNSTGPQIIIVDPEPMVEDRHAVADNLKKIVELGKLHIDQELKFPINNNLLVGNESSTSVPSSASPLGSYPIIDVSNLAPTIPSVSPTFLYPMSPPPSISHGPPPPPPVYPALPHLPSVYPALPHLPSVYPAPPPQPSVSSSILYPRLPPPLPLPAPPVPSAPKSAVGLAGKNQVEDKLLRELEEMGFKQIDLNKEVLRMNEYDLEQALNDLCGVTEWDLILEELQEMGFHDTEMNKKLLKKNNGSIKRVVMDLITGEKI